MKTLKKMTMVMAAAMVMASGAAMAAEHAAGHDANCLKDCQMVVKSCDRDVDTLPQRITRLQGEIAKGSAVYSADEVKTLERKLKETEDQLANITFGG